MNDEDFIGNRRHGGAKCREGARCTGPGCRVATGKTQRKKNWLRPKPNKHEGTRVTASPGKGKR